jgi:uncharacterized membrane protein YfcA
MNKTIIIISLTVFSIVFNFIPYLWGDTNPFGGWAILTSTIGGLFGIWLGVWVSKRIGD